jgi:hypothetical protein
MRVDSSAGARSLTGDGFRQALGLKSNWFTVSVPGAGARQYVSALYLDLLGRPVDQPAEAHWTAALGAATITRGALAALVATCDERLGVMVDALYTGVLGRSADAGGRAYWMSALRGGIQPARATATFYGSDEFFVGASGAQLATYVHELYRRILRRDADPGGHSYWTQVAATQGRSAVAWAMYQSPESVWLRLDQLYQSLLGRAPDPSGGAYWSGVLAGQGEITVSKLLTASDEYFARAQARF